MELSKKTTILFSPELHAQLQRMARQGGTSIGELVRSACVSQYGLWSRQERLEALRELTSLNLPVASPEEMAEESVASPSEIVP